MGIKEDIFEEFFKTLEEEEIPESTINELKILKEHGELISETKLLNMIERGCKDGNENKKN